MSWRNETLPCLVCGKQLLQSMPDGTAPDDGVLCTTTGNYGSTVFDPFDGETLRFNICDQCLTEAGDAGRVVSGYPVQQVVYEDGDGEQWAVGHVPLTDPADVPRRADLPPRDIPPVVLEAGELDDPPTGVVPPISGTLKEHLKRKEGNVS